MEASTPRPVAAAELRRAIEHDELCLYLQPLVDLTDGRIRGAEALVRWQHPDHGLLPPAAFLGLAQSCGLMIALGRWVAGEAVRLRATWPRGVFVSVNVGPEQLAGADGVHLVESLSSACLQHEVSPSDLWIEITETERVDAAAARLTLEKLNELGVRTAIDDFGTGYASVSLLRDLPVSVCKIDGSFVAGLGAGHVPTTVVRSIVEMAGAYGMTVVGEGVENALQLHQLADLGCDLAQGFHLHRPMPATAFQRLVGPPNRSQPLRFERTRPSHAPDQRVMFYADEEHLVGEIVAFLAPALEADGTVVMIAGTARAEAVRRGLRRAGVDTVRAARRHRLLFLDARRTLADIASDGWPEREPLERLLARPVTDALARGRPARVYGEMVSVLLERAQKDQALRLETIGHELAGDLGFSSLCAYPLDAFAEDLEGGDFEAVCHHHTAVLPTEQLRVEAGPAQLWRSVAQLEQQAVAAAGARRRALERERHLEDRLAQALELRDELRGEVERLAYELRQAATTVGVAVESLDLVDAREADGAAPRARTVAATSASRIEDLTRRLLGLVDTER